MGAAALLMAVLIVVLPLSRDHTVHDADPAIEPVPTSVDEVAWQWEPDEDTIVERVHPGPAGPLVLTDTGAIALSGSTGDELWSHTITERDGTRIETGTTPGGEHTLIAQAEGEPPHEEDGSASGGATGGPFETEVAVIDSLTGELQDRYTYTDEDPLSDLHNLAGDTWLEPDQDGLRARSINDGQTAWTYEPPENCELTHHSENRRFDGPVVGTTADTYLLPLSCPTDKIRAALDHDPDELPEKAPGQLTALDTRTGDPVWPEPVDLTLIRVHHPPEYHYVPAGFLPSPDEQHALAPTPDGDSVVDVASGQVLTTEAHQGRTHFFSSGALHSSRTTGDGREILQVTETDVETGNQIGEQTTLDPSGHELQGGAGHDFLGQNSYDRAFSLLPLDDGMLTFGCTNACPESPDHPDEETTPLSGLYFPTGEKEPEATEIDLPGFEASQGPNQEHLVPTPGAIVAVQYTSDSPSGIAPLTGLA
ncbi:hypothetical protein IDM40_19810 [Nocardiopsis sp. HNM0947]|uniref:PQQ-like domain-containing protein n=1 Tax=Nocardiopsis coralli TaxID=2772213 RepID=A0ABR9PB47_9ACTN|nr:hypothetical protein [Nocardiopsis coralli]MBE3000920.1 hypothetical protein [Nocardiopsis coralli]